MKYMIMMFGSAAEMMETQSPDWIREMIAFMQNLDVELRNAGELVFNAGLADGSTAKTVSLVDGLPVTTDGPFAEAKESLVGYWLASPNKRTALGRGLRSFGRRGDVGEKARLADKLRMLFASTAVSAVILRRE